MALHWAISQHTSAIGFPEMEPKLDRNVDRGEDIIMIKTKTFDQTSSCCVVDFLTTKRQIRTGGDRLIIVEA